MSCSPCLGYRETIKTSVGHTVAQRGWYAPGRRWWGHTDVLVLWRRAIASPDLPARGYQVLVGTWVWSSGCGWGQPGDIYDAHASLWAAPAVLGHEVLLQALL